MTRRAQVATRANADCIAVRNVSSEVAHAWPPYAARAAVLAELERAIAAAPEALDARFYQASFLRDHGRCDDAIAVFEDILARAPDHVETLVAYGVVLARRGRRRDARAAFERAVADRKSVV